MEAIITEMAENFITKIFETVKKGGTLHQIEEAAFREAKAFAAQTAVVYAESVDAALVADKSGRRESGYTIERRGDVRHLQTLLGEVVYHRTYFQKASGGYEYLTDTVLGVDKHVRVSDSLSTTLVKAAKDMSYSKASRHLTGNTVSRQTVMEKLRRSHACKPELGDRRRVPELHIDADEAHVTMCGGKKSEVPLISVYEGIERQGKRHVCKNIFHISEYGKIADALWEQVLTEVELRYDLTGTKIYLHGDGGAWIQKGMEWFPGATFVLDKYHKNKAIQSMVAGLDKPERKLFDREIRSTLNREDLDFFDQIVMSLEHQLPHRADIITESARYLKNFVSGISVCERDPSANNGGCTEPHVSHVLSARLSARPMAWSKCTLKRLAPMLAGGEVCKSAPDEKKELPAPLRNAATSARKALRRGKAGLPSPDAIGTLPITGKITGTQKILKSFIQ